MKTRHLNSLWTKVYELRFVYPLLICLLAGRQQANAQLNPMGSLYFQNQYIGNPAMAGMDHKLKMNLGYRTQWNNIPGSPTLQTITADYGFNNRVGVGLNIYNDKAGLFKRTRAVASYAYHLPLNAADQHLNFGLSLGFMNERISSEDINGDANDANLINYNQRDTYIDGDFGIAYTSNHFSIQAALPNMKSIFKKDLIENAVDRSTFYSAVSYKFQLSGGNNGFDLEPKIAYRGVKGFDNILDAGANLSYGSNRVSLFGMYHSSESATFGMGLNYQALGIYGMYTTATSALSGYANGDFEISLRLNLFK